MCLNIQVLCPGCKRLVEQIYEECFFPGWDWGHMIFQEIRTVQTPELFWWSCPTEGCEMNQSLQWSLASMCETAIRDGQSYSQSHPYTTLEVEGEGDDEGDDEVDEACELALSPEEVGIPSAPKPEFLPAEDRLTARTMFENGETIKAVAEVVSRSCSSMSKYVAAYYRPNPYNSYDSKGASAVNPEQDGTDGNEHSYSQDDHEEPLPPISINTIKPVPGAPSPRWLSARERRLVQKLRARGETKRTIVETLGKPRVKLVSYINAYIIPHESVSVAGPASSSSPVPAPAPAPAPTATANKRKRTDEEATVEPTRFSKRLRAKHGAVCVDSIVGMSG